ncbi:MAG: hypothetical protein V4564_20405 [Pseudomonadota bacterium]
MGKPEMLENDPIAVAKSKAYRRQMVPEHLWRHPTRAAIDALALRFDLPNHHSMQDWEWEVADPNRLDDFIGAYQSGELNDDELFTLMEMIVQSFDNLGGAVSRDPRWRTARDLLDTNIRIHAHTVWYWSCPEMDAAEEQWAITPFIRPIFEKNRARLLPCN